MIKNLQQALSPESAAILQGHIDEIDHARRFAESREVLYYSKKGRPRSSRAFPADLRHTFATRAVAGGVDLPTLSAMLGHTSIQMTMRYVHPAEEQKKIAAGKLEAFRIAGIIQAIEKNRSATISPSTSPTTVN